jgi:hypothetical protein
MPMNEFEDDAANDELHVEITDLDPIEEAPHLTRMLLSWKERPSLHKRFWHIATVCCSVLFIWLVLFSTFPSVRGLTFGIFARLTPTHVTGSTSTAASPDVSYTFNAREAIAWTANNSAPIVPSITLGPAPQNCMLGSQTRPIDIKDAPLAAGGSPVWIIGLGGPSASLIHLKHALPPEIGWYQQIDLLTATNYAGTVTLRGGEMRSGTPIWFGMRDHKRGPMTSFTVRPLDTSVSNHTGSDQQWGLLTTTVYVSKAGCYFLTATWPKGGWVVFFSAGAHN